MKHVIDIFEDTGVLGNEFLTEIQLKPKEKISPIVT